MNRPSKPDAGPYIHDWQIVMVADCNLRCPHCATKHGRYGRRRGVMRLETAARLAEQMIAHRHPDGRPTVLSFGGGETFLDFDRFIRIADILLKKARTAQAPIRIDVTTHGGLLNERRLRQLAQRHINLGFSIDGPESVHDNNRRTAAGVGTFRSAFANWVRYRNICRTTSSSANCSMHSVFLAQDGSLRDLIEFWLEQDVLLPKIQPINHSRFETAAQRNAVRRIQQRYEEDLRAWAMDQAGRCSVPDFLSRYRGPALIYQGWKRLLLETEKPVCTPGRGVLAVHYNGDLYPCEAYIGVDRWKLGDLVRGLKTSRLAAFTAQCQRAEAVCRACDSRIPCEKTCLATIATETPLQNVRRHCKLAQRIAHITQESYERLLRPTTTRS